MPLIPELLFSLAPVLYTSLEDIWRIVVPLFGNVINHNGYQIDSGSQPGLSLEFYSI